VGHLRHDFILEVPREDKDVVGLRFLDFLRSVNRYVRARQELPLLVETAVDCVVDEVGPNSAVVQESLLCPEPLPRNGFFLALRLDQKFEQLALLSPSPAP
jgi:hypothetical protein